MNMETLKVIINEQGRVEIKVEGIAGDACLLITKDLEKILGTVIEREMTSEAYEDADGKEHLKIQS